MESSFSVTATPLSVTVPSTPTLLTSSSSSTPSATTAVNETTITEEEENILPLIGDFFICRDYETKYFSFTSSISSEKPVIQPLDCLVAASTDFDLTGQIVWPAARLTSYYITYLGHTHELYRKNILELGSGTGLCGLIASQFNNNDTMGDRTIQTINSSVPSSSSSKSCVCLSDNEPEVLAILERNLSHSGKDSQTFIQDLDWGNTEHYKTLSQYIYRLQPHQLSTTSFSSSSNTENTLSINNNNTIYRWPLIIGADIVYWSSAIVPLINAVTSLLAPKGVFILGYFNRLSTNQELLENEAKKQGLSFTIIPHTVYLPFQKDTNRYPADVETSLSKMWIYRFTWTESI